MEGDPVKNKILILVHYEKRTKEWKVAKPYCNIIFQIFPYRMDPEMEARQPFKIANIDRTLHQNIDISIVAIKKT